MDKAVFRKRLHSARRRLAALAAAGATLWLASVTAGAQTLSAAASAAWEALPLSVLRWELGDLRRQDDPMSAAAMLAISQSPLLLSAREEVADLWSREEGDQPAPENTEPEPPTVTGPRPAGLRQPAMTLQRGTPRHPRQLSPGHSLSPASSAAPCARRTGRTSCRHDAADRERRSSGTGSPERPRSGSPRDEF